MVTVEAVMAVAKANEGKTLHTLARAKPFKVYVHNGAPQFVPLSSNRKRTATDRRKLEEITFNRTGSLKTPACAGTKSQNLSYILCLIRLATEA